MRWPLITFFQCILFAELREGRDFGLGVKVWRGVKQGVNLQLNQNFADSCEDC